MADIPGPESKLAVIEQLDALFAPWNRTDQPGLIVGISRNDRLLYRRGFGMASLETAVANTPKTRMRIGSVSKHFTALLALRLAEDGKLDLDLPIRTYIPELAGPGGDPTVRQLLGHRGGSRCYLDILMLNRGIHPSLGPIGFPFAAQIRQIGRNFMPGEALIYSNGGYHLVSIAIERVGGASFEAQIKERLFDVVGMPDTASVPGDYEIQPGVATLHERSSNGGWRRGLLWIEEMRGEGAIISTVDDMLRWTAHLRNRDRFGSAKAWNELIALKPYGYEADLVYALGLYVNEYRGIKLIHHGGGVAGGTSNMVVVPDYDLDIVVLANGAPGADLSRLAEQVIDIVLADKVGTPAVTLDSKRFQGMLGDWWSPETGMIYSLFDDEGIVKLSFSKRTLSFPVERMKGGRIGVSERGNFSEIVLGLKPDRSDDQLSISFGGKTAQYRRVSNEGVDQAAFEKAVVGRYKSADSGGSVAIGREAWGLVACFADDFGAVSMKLVPVGETVAYTTELGTPPNSAALTFERTGDRFGSFRLNTMRTRNLVYKRE